MNELNLQNDEFLVVVNHITQADNKIVVWLHPQPFGGTLGTMLLLESFDSLLSEVQTWELTIVISRTIKLVSFYGLTTFDEIKTKLR
jgi:hypothetical protein